MPVQRLLHELVPPVYRFALRLTGGDRHEAEDLTQETMLRAWRHRERLSDAQPRDDQPEADEDDPHALAVRRWLFRVLVNAWRDELRRRTRRARPETRAAVAATRPALAPPEPEHLVLVRDDADHLLAALDRLPPRQREVLYLSACEQLAVRDIAVVLDLAPEAVKASLSLARSRLRAVTAADAAAPAALAAPDP